LKQLLAIAIAGICAVLLLAFAAKAWFNMSQGRPIAHATGVGFVLLRGGLTIVVLIVIFAGIALWQWLLYYTRPKWPL